MAWSTRELAELTGTTVNTIRHYHRLGLLPEPERRYNGYKLYGVPDLVRLLRIRRLAELGVPLAEIAAAGPEGTLPPEALRRVDTELAADIARLAQAREDIAAILRDDAPADIPPGFEAVAARLSPADRSLISIYRHLYDDQAMADVRRMVEEDTNPVSDDFDALPADADEATRHNLAEKLAPVIAQHLIDYPWLRAPGPRLSKSESVVRQTFLDAIGDLYNPAQRDVLAQASILAHEQVARDHDA
ncbi:MerR family transcriptional regulator [Actinoplanes bogorensis]|uniref:MerR family transcriptional regulator n=1 Tax=Paractinoplanes bogorensis TaxID=1610840 RepID=A0ABS5YXI1_9ACTN|nr:MerR family transcriptional regulator [Actinoplanes bogorensis]MBU2668140.1 MerR family transcriptional regulator [Actinoplanes bogorensis]